MVATGILDKPKKPYFHFQEYKPSQTFWRFYGTVAEAMLIAQYENENEKLIYGCEIMGVMWRFVILGRKKLLCFKGF